MDADPQGRVGDILSNKYRLKILLGTGSMGEVYLAENTLIERQVAIKVMLPEHATDPQTVERFMSEARAANIVRHPNVVDVLDIGQDAAGTPFIVQEYLEGQDLESHAPLLRKQLAPIALIEVLLPVLDAFAFAHTKGVIHRDIKPSNVFLAQVGDKVVPKVLDFGIAKLSNAPQNRRMTATGVTMGTPHYMSPEVIRLGAAQADARADVWSIGVLLFEVLSGSVPFEDESVNGLFMKICLHPPNSLSEVAPAVPESIARIVMRCLEKEPAARFADAGQLATELRSALQSMRAMDPSLALAEFDRVMRDSSGTKARVPAGVPDLIGPGPTIRQVQPGAAGAASAAAPTDGSLPAVPDLVLGVPSRPAPALRSSSPPAQQAAPSQAAPAPSGSSRPVSSQAPPVVHSSAPPVSSRPPISRRPAGIELSGAAPVRSTPPRPRPTTAPRILDTDEDVGRSEPFTVLVMFVLLADAAGAQLVGGDVTPFFARTAGHYVIPALGVSAGIVAVIGLYAIKILWIEDVYKLPPLLFGGGALGYAAVLALGAVQAAGLFGLPSLTKILVPVSLGCLGIGGAFVGLGRAWRTWTLGRHGIRATAFVLAGLAGAGLAVWCILTVRAL